MTTTVFRVNGMTCAHCVNAVSSQLSKLLGVSDVAVDLDTGDVTVTCEQTIDHELVRSAVLEAGYEFVG